VPLRWEPESPADISINKLPKVTEGAISDFFIAVAPLIELETKPTGNSIDTERATSSSGQRGNIFDVIQALARIPNAGPPDWEHWNRIGPGAVGICVPSTSKWPPDQERMLAGNFDRLLEMPASFTSFCIEFPKEKGVA
jgi:hypothetical protein